MTAVILAVALDLLNAGRIQVTPYTVVCPGLPEAFSGLKIALITDLHGAFLDAGGAALARAATGADLIAISGDLFDRNTRQGQIVPAMRALCQVAPVYYVSGNHEWTVEDRQQIWGGNGGGRCCPAGQPMGCLSARRGTDSLGGDSRPQRTGGPGYA